MSQLPDLHKQAFLMKNKRRLQHDGGRAWIKDSQLHAARAGADLKLEYSDKKGTPKSVKKA